MTVTDTRDNSRHEVLIEHATVADIKIAAKNRFDFDWLKPTGSLTLKLILKDTKIILGLMSITDRPENFAIEINMLESSKENIGKSKSYGGIAGCMIAYVARESFKKGYEGFVYLLPKTELIEHYKNIYGMKYTGRYMVVEKVDSFKLIQRYLET